MKFNPWPVFITIICVAALAAATTVVVVMVSKKVELVAPDYYARDQRHGEQMAQERRAHALSRPLAVSLDPAASSIDIAFPAKEVSGTITLFRPSDLNLDQTFDIAIDESNHQRIPAQDLAAGLWRVRVQWTQHGELYYHETAVMLP